ncbi:DHHA1 domain-containing protein, partial [Eubacterium pyruvativorans]|uniref:DHHA1 domain-containing protein n=1 Tax=Eubacterium pyruvativorans TaxID=155865 RepID=UPI00156A5243
INAAGRMEHARLAAELFMTKDNGQADARVEDLIRCNSGRKSAQERIYEECVRRVESDFRQDDFLTVDLPDANEGVTGIAAGKLKDRYYKPAVILTPIGDGMYKGTGRGIEGVNLYDMLKENEELFTNFGGHAAACGFTMKAGALETLRSNLNRQAAALRAGKPELWERHIVPDLVLEADEVNRELAEQFTLLEPCGCQNEKPLVRFRAAADSVRRIGENGKYLCFDAELENMRRVRCIAFRAAEEARGVLEQAGGSAVQVTGSLQEKTWNGRSYLEMLVAEVENPRD